MSRFGKQIIYGAVFLAILSLLGFGLYAFFQPEQSCTNNRHDWGEGGVDCGGRCANACIPANLREIVILEPQFFRQNDTIGVLLRLTNPNSGYAANEFRYRLEFIAGEKVVRTRDVTTFLYPDEIRYEVEFADIADANTITHVRAKGMQVAWGLADRFGRPNLSIQDRSTQIAGNLIRGSGRVVNHEVTEVGDVTVLALYHGRSGLTGVSKTELGSLEGGTSREFAVVHPSLQEFEAGRTEYFVFARRSASR